jgi:hypothetical protein
MLAACALKTDRRFLARNSLVICYMLRNIFLSQCKNPSALEREANSRDQEPPEIESHEREGRKQRPRDSGRPKEQPEGATLSRALLDSSLDTINKPRAAGARLELIWK